MEIEGTRREKVPKIVEESCIFLFIDVLCCLQWINDDIEI